MKQRVDAKMFWAVKTLLKGGASQREAADFFHLGIATVGRINASESPEEYHNILAALHAKNRARKAAVKQDEQKPVPAPQEPEKAPCRPANEYYVNNHILQALKEQNELLKLISAKLAFIVEQLA